MSAPKRIQLRRTKGWKMPEGAVKVDRSTDHGNPYRVQREGNRWHVLAPGFRLRSTHDSKAAATAAAVDEFRRWITSGDYPAQRRRILAQDRLRGRDLACWCSLDAPCHADVLLEIANP